MRLVEVLDDSVAVVLKYLGGNAFHAKDFDLEALAIRQRILDVRQVLFVDLVKMDGET